MSDTSARANSKALQQGLIVLGLILFGGYLLFDRGLVGVLLEGDKSRLSWLILAIWLGMSARWLLCLLYTSPSPRDRSLSRMPSSA